MNVWILLLAFFSCNWQLSKSSVIACVNVDFSLVWAKFRSKMRSKHFSYAQTQQKKSDKEEAIRKCANHFRHENESSGESCFNKSRQKPLEFRSTAGSSQNTLENGRRFILIKVARNYENASNAPSAPNTSDDSESIEKCQHLKRIDELTPDNHSEMSNDSMYQTYYRIHILGTFHNFVIFIQMQFLMTNSGSEGGFQCGQFKGLSIFLGGFIWWRQLNCTNKS